MRTFLVLLAIVALATITLGGAVAQGLDAPAVTAAPERDHRIRVSVDPIRVQLTHAGGRRGSRRRSATPSAPRITGGNASVTGPLVVINGERGGIGPEQPTPPVAPKGVDPALMGGLLEAAQKGKGVMAEGVWDTPTAGGGRMFIRFDKGRMDPDGKFFSPAGGASTLGLPPAPAGATPAEIPGWVLPAGLGLVGLGLLAWLASHFGGRPPAPATPARRPAAAPAPIAPANTPAPDPPA